MSAPYPVIISKKHNGTVGWLSDKTLEAAGQSYKQDQLVLTAVGGAISITVSGSAAEILGVATADATGVTSAVAKVSIVEPGDFLEMTLCNASTTPVVAVLADLYNAIGLYVSGGSCFANQGAATFGQIVDLVLDSTGAYTSRVLVTPFPSCLVVSASGL